MASWHVETLSGADQLPCWRDANQNGYIDPTKVPPHHGHRHPLPQWRQGKSRHVHRLPTMRRKPRQQFISQVGADTTFLYTLVDTNAPFHIRTNGSCCLDRR